MIIDHYIHEKHFPLLADWLSRYGIKVPPRELFSDLGVVVDGCAIGFLFKGGNSKTAYIDHVAADPGIEPGRRGNALDELFAYLEGSARRDGYVMVTALASLPTMRRRFEGRGYTRHGEYGLYFKLLNEEVSSCLGSHRQSEG